jgi:hypothetical protein
MLSIPEALLLCLASYRATQLAVHDTIGDPARDLVFRWHATEPDSRVRTAIITLISCIYCTGWWLSGLILAVYLLTTGRWHETPILVHGIEWFAVAGGAALLNRWDDSRKPE